LEWIKIFPCNGKINKDSIPKERFDGHILQMYPKEIFDGHGKINKD
jgi:hypothetical protein